MPDAWNEILTELLSSLSFDLGITTTAYDERLSQYLKAAYISISTMGIVLDAEDIEHRNLVISHAAWQWRRRDSGEGMPRMVQYGIHNALMHQKMREETDG